MKNKYRKDFPILKKLIYLDNAASTLKPKSVINFLSNYYTNYPLNPHSLKSNYGTKIAEILKDARQTVANFFNCDVEGIVYNSGTTSAFNAIATMMSQILKPGDEIILSTQEHVSNIIPWFEVAKKTSAKIIFLEGTLKHDLTIDEVISKVTPKTRIISLALMTNIKGTVIDFSILRKSLGKKIYIICDAAQAVSHMKIDFKKWDIDFLGFSGTKIYGPFGCGALIAKQEHLDKFYPSIFGGGAYKNIDTNGWTRLPGFMGHEPGTPNAPGIAMLSEAIKYLQKADFKEVLKHELDLIQYCTNSLMQIENVVVYTDPSKDQNVVFNIKGFSGIDVAYFLGNKNIIVRAGRHCAPMLYKEVDSAIRVSFGLYNTRKDIDAMINLLKSTKDYLQL